MGVFQLETFIRYPHYLGHKSKVSKSENMKLAILAFAAFVQLTSCWPVEEYFYLETRLTGGRVMTLSNGMVVINTNNVWKPSFGDLMKNPGVSGARPVNITVSQLLPPASSASPVIMVKMDRNGR